MKIIRYVSNFDVNLFIAKVIDIAELINRSCLCRKSDYAKNNYIPIEITILDDEKENYNDDRI